MATSKELIILGKKKAYLDDAREWHGPDLPPLVPKSAARKTAARNLILVLWLEEEDEE